ncbi:MAG: hypothetical protein WAN51_12840 [Alphaproteobacteria bacterium]
MRTRRREPRPAARPKPFLNRIAVIEETIATTSAGSLADAAVQLGRIEAAPEEATPEITRRLASALAAIERAAMGDVATIPG